MNSDADETLLCCSDALFCWNQLITSESSCGWWPRRSERSLTRHWVARDTRKKGNASVVQLKQKWQPAHQKRPFLPVRLKTDSAHQMENGTNVLFLAGIEMETAKHKKTVIDLRSPNEGPRETQVIGLTSFLRGAQRLSRQSPPSICWPFLRNFWQHLQPFCAVYVGLAHSITLDLRWDHCIFPPPWTEATIGVFSPLFVKSHAIQFDLFLQVDRGWPWSFSPKLNDHCSCITFFFLGPHLLADEHPPIGEYLHFCPT